MQQCKTNHLKLQDPQAAKCYSESSCNVYACGRLTALYYRSVCVVCAACPSVWTVHRSVEVPGHVKPTAHEGEFGRAINSPLVVFHSGELCQGEDLTQGQNSVTDLVKENW